MSTGGHDVGRAWITCGIVLVAVAAAPRLLLVALIHGFGLNPPFNPDGLDYLSFAHNLVSGNGFALSVDGENPFSPIIELSSYRPPAYPVFLAACFSITHSLAFVRVMQAGLAAGTALLLMRTGTIAFNLTAGLAAGLMYALYPPLIFAFSRAC